MSQHQHRYCAFASAPGYRQAERMGTPAHGAPTGEMTTCSPVPTGHCRAEGELCALILGVAQSACVCVEMFKSPFFKGRAQRRHFAVSVRARGQTDYARVFRSSSTFKPACTASISIFSMVGSSPVSLKSIRIRSAHFKYL